MRAKPNCKFNFVAKIWAEKKYFKNYFKTAPSNTGEVILFSSKKHNLIIKLIRSSSPLSVQLHPSLQSVKNEIWFFLNGGKNFYAGVKTDDFNLLTENTFGQMRKIKALKHSFFTIPAGMVHCLTPGLTVLEIQNFCKKTLRIFDFCRNRKLNLSQARKNLKNINVKKQIKTKPSFRFKNFKIRFINSAEGTIKLNNPAFLINLTSPLYINKTEVPPFNVLILKEKMYNYSKNKGFIILNND